MVSGAPGIPCRGLCGSSCMRGTALMRTDGRALGVRGNPHRLTRRFLPLPLCGPFLLHPGPRTFSGGCGHVFAVGCGPPVDALVNPGDLILPLAHRLPPVPAAATVSSAVSEGELSDPASPASHASLPLSVCEADLPDSLCVRYAPHPA